MLSRRRRSGGMKRLLLTVLAVSALTAAAPQQASACSCIPLKLTKKTFRSYDAAVAGRIVKRTVKGHTARHKVRLLRVFRGGRLKGRRFVTVRTAAHGASCGWETPVGSRIGALLIRGPRTGKWHSNLCLTTSPRDLRLAAKKQGFARTVRCPRPGLAAQRQ